MTSGTAVKYMDDIEPVRLARGPHHDAFGRRRILLAQRHHAPVRHQLTIPTEQLASGVYYITTLIPGSRQTKAQALVVMQ